MVSPEFLDRFFDVLGSFSFIVFLALLLCYMWEILKKFFIRWRPGSALFKMEDEICRDGEVRILSKPSPSFRSTLLAYFANVEPSSSPSSTSFDATKPH